MSRKETTLPVSTVSILALAVVLGHLFLPIEPPSPSSWPLGEVAEIDGAVLSFEVPSSDAGRAFERQQLAIHQVDASQPSSLVPSTLGSLAQEEIQALWDRGISRLLRPAEVHDAASPFLLTTLAACVLGLAAFLADARDAAAEEEEKQREEVATARAPDALEVSWRFKVPKLPVVGFALVAVILLSCTVATTPVRANVTVAKAELQKLLLLNTQSAGSFSDGLVATSFVVWGVLALRVAMTDHCEIVSKLEEEQLCDKARQPSPSASDICPQPLIGAAAGAAAGLAAIVWIGSPSAPSVGIAEAELMREVATTVARRFRWAPSDQAVAIVVAIAGLLGAATAHLDIREEADRCDRKSQAVRSPSEGTRGEHVVGVVVA